MDDATKDRIVSLHDRYLTAMHAMQTGVKLLAGRSNGECSPPNLRVGVNSALVDSGALAGLLIQKGLITEEEYRTALAESAEAEVERYRQRALEMFGRDITLM